MPQDFRLVRFFAPASLVAFVLAAALLGYAFRKFSVDGLVQAQEQANVNLTTILGNDLWPRDFAPLVRAVADRPDADLGSAPQLAAVHARVIERMKGSSTFKVKVYDMRGRTVYSTELAQIGEDKSANLGVVAALRGETTSELVHRNRFSALEEEVLDRDLIQSYIPQYSRAGEVIGVFEVYTDVTALLQQIGRRQWYVMGAVAAALAALYAVVFAIVGTAQRILLARRREEQVLKDLELGRRKSEFLTATAHELRTPMTSIYGFAELLKTRAYDAEASRGIVDSIHAEASRMVRMLNELLELSRIEERAGPAFRLELQPLAPLLQSAAAALAVPGDPRVPELVVEPGLPPLALDAEKMRQALLNVLSNAYKFSAGTPIRVEAFRDPAGGRVGVRVTDRGIGMTAEELAQLFERFWRSERVQNIPGSGLGLALVKEIVAHHGGSVEVQSRPGEGTRVTLWLPCDAESVGVHAR
jgi:signal transduction histidine kinase